MTMLEKYLMNLFTFTLYFIIIYVNVTAVIGSKYNIRHVKVTDDTQRPPACDLPQDNSRRCDKTTWFFYNSIELNKAYLIKTEGPMSVEACLDICVKDYSQSCVAVAMEKKDQSCIILSEGFESEHEHEFDSYIAKCCFPKDPLTGLIDPPSEPGGSGSGSGGSGSGSGGSGSGSSGSGSGSSGSGSGSGGSGLEGLIGSKYNIREVKVTDDTQRPPACELPYGNLRSCDKTTWFHYNDIEINYNPLAALLGPLSVEACLNFCLNNSQSCVAIAIDKTDKTCYMFGGGYRSKQNCGFDTYIARCCFPSGSGGPGEPGVSREPGGPGGPGVSGEPGGQGGPDVSGEPREPGGPGGQGVSGEPGEPGGQGVSGEPGEPGGPGGPGEPGGPGGPGGSGQKSGDVPIVANLNYACYSRSADLSPSTPGDIVYTTEENIDISMSPYSSSTSTTTQACQRECAKNSNCRAVSVERNGNVCHFYSEFTKDSSGNSNKEKNKQIFYIKFKCEIKKNELLFQKDDLLIVSDHRPFCQEVSQSTANRCPSLIWTFLDETKYNGILHLSYYLGIRMDALHSCLNDCLNIRDCYGVSIDHSEHKCYAFYEGYDGVKETVPQTSWSSYKLQCCNQPKLE